MMVITAVRLLELQATATARHFSLNLRVSILQGQGGISKATVSIVFHNDDPRQSPAGYEHCETITVTRTIVIGGRNKYLINGHAVQAGAVADFFHSVQLNVNNPHFLIMQASDKQLIHAAEKMQLQGDADTDNSARCQQLPYVTCYCLLPGTCRVASPRC